LDTVRRALLLSLPAATLFVGICLAQHASGQGWPARVDVTVALVAAAAGPLVAMLVLIAVDPGFDSILVATAAMLTAIGATTLHSLSLSGSQSGAFYQAIAVRHGVFVCAGFLALVGGVVVSRHLDQIRKYPFTLLGFALILTMATVVFGQTVNGARLWLAIGPTRFQPSEVARLLLAGFVAVYLYDRRHLVVAPWRVASLDLPPAPYLLPLVGAVLSAVAVLVFQNDLGMAALVVLGAYGLVAGVLNSKSSLASAGGILAIAAVASFAVAPRVRDRVAAWLESWQDPTGRGFQFVQSEYGLAAGGVVGQVRPALAARVPEVHTDFILIGLGTQWGWIGALAVLGLTSIVVSRCVIAAMRAADGFRALVALAIAALSGIQAMLIIGGTLRVLPLTGLTLPLVSSGGTSMVATLFALGIVVGIGSGQTRESHS
jgi:cell division protein FtsW (lipid II flippase)